jgi:hypothetical protein
LQRDSINLPIMKTQRKQQRSMNSIATGRWTAYMAAAAASTFAGAGSAEAEIHYSGHVAVKLSGNAHASLPLSNGASLFFENINFGSTFEQFFFCSIKGVISGSARGEDFGYSRIFLSKLGLGENVSAGRFYSVAGNPNHGVLFTNWSDGNFAANSGRVRGFVGFRFNTGNGTQYGWARIETKNDFNNHPNHVHDVIKDYAWGDVGDAISTGQTQSLQPANANSVTGSLGLLAFGAQGLEAWRTQCPEKSD